MKILKWTSRGRSQVQWVEYEISPMRVPTCSSSAEDGHYIGLYVCTKCITDHSVIPIYQMMISNNFVAHTSSYLSFSYIQFTFQKSSLVLSHWDYVILFSYIVDHKSVKKLSTFYFFYPYRVSSFKCRIVAPKSAFQGNAWQLFICNPQLNRNLFFNCAMYTIWRDLNNFENCCWKWIHIWT